MKPEYSGVKHVFREMLHLIRRFTIGRKPRLWLLKLAGARVGKNVYIGPDLFIFDSGRTELLCVEDDVGIGPQVMIIMHASRTGPVLKKQYPTKMLPVTIKKGASIGARVTILPGVTIGEHALIAAGSVVTGDIPAYSMAAGVPARVKKRLPVQKESA